jgi:predicted transcriptional regulator
MAKHSVHIGKKIKEILHKTPISVVDFAKSINLTRNGAYKVFEKETIDTGQLQTISKVLNHDFFVYYDSFRVFL